MRRSGKGNPPPAIHRKTIYPYYLWLDGIVNDLFEGEDFERGEVVRVTEAIRRLCSRKGWPCICIIRYPDTKPRRPFIKVWGVMERSDGKPIPAEALEDFANWGYKPGRGRPKSSASKSELLSHQPSSKKLL